MLRYGWIALMVLFLMSCEKDIEFNLLEPGKTLVVDGSIENGKPPRIILTNSISYYDPLNFNTISNLFVRNAEVVISDGINTHRLKEYAEPIFPGFNTYYYSIDSSDLSSAVIGEFNRNYNLSIRVDGKIYTSATSIPALTWYPDSLFTKPMPFTSDTNARKLFARINEPRGLGNYLRYFTKRNREPFYPGRNSVFSDALVDGTTYTTDIDPGFDPNNPVEFDQNYFKKNDTVVLKICNIDRNSYQFWNTWEFSRQNLGNPFSQPNKVLGNINNGALGAFCGYACWYDTIHIQ
jgi:hypothetical protein